MGGYSKDIESEYRITSLDVDSFRRGMISAAAVTLNELRFTKEGCFIMTLREERGLFDAMAYARLHDPQLQIIREQNPDMYLTILASHLIGGGAYIGASMIRNNKDINDYYNVEINAIVKELIQGDLYEHGLNALRVDVNSREKIAIDNAIILIRDSAKELDSRLIDEDELLTMYMKVFYDVGFTLAGVYVYVNEVKKVN